MSSASGASSAPYYSSPQMNTVGSCSDSFVICDPAGPYTIFRRTGEACVVRDIVIIGTGPIAGASVGGIWLALDASAWQQPAIPLFVLGGFLGALVGTLASSLPLAGSLAYQAISDRRYGRPRKLRISDRESLEWLLCDLAWQIGRVASWRDKTVDPERRVASIVWAAVERTLDADRQYGDAIQAIGHPGLKQLGEQVLAKIEAERRSLKAVAANLCEVLKTARGIDADRLRVAEQRKLADERGLEERELLRRLTGEPRSADSDFQSDRSAGLVAETEAIADWLAESDRMLRDL